MKKILSFLLVLTLMMGVCSLTACDLFNQLVGNQSTESTTTTTTTTTTIPNKPVPPTNECVHSFGEWITVSAATFESTGLKKQVCSKCTYIHWEEIPVLRIDITLWVSPTAGMREFTAEKIEEFIENHPEYSKYRVNIETVGEGAAASEVIENVAKAPDMYCFAQDQISRLVQGGALAALDESATQAVISNNDAGSVLAATFENTVYAYPFVSDNGYYLYYDASVISDEEAQTLEGIIAACQRSGKKFGYNLTNAWFMAGMFFSTPIGNSTPLCVSTWTYSDDGKKVLSVNDTFNSENGLMIMKVLNSIAQSGVWKDTSDDFKGTAAIVSGVWNAETASKTYGKNMRAVKLPTFTVDGQEYQMGSYAGYKLIGCKPQEDSEKAQFCNDLALYLTSEEVQYERYLEFQWGPSNVSVQNHEDVKSNMILTALLEQNVYAQPQGVIPGDWWTEAAALGVCCADGIKTDEELLAALGEYESKLQEMLSK